MTNWYNEMIEHLALYSAFLGRFCMKLINSMTDGDSIFLLLPDVHFVPQPLVQSRLIYIRPGVADWKGGSKTSKPRVPIEMGSLLMLKQILVKMTDVAILGYRPYIAIQELIFRPN